MTIRSFGEPWRERPQYFSGGVRDYQRAIACVNALAGRDPAKLAELEAAIDSKVNVNNYDAWVVGVRRALAAFKGEPA